jgi:hypothetical protein
VKNIFNNRQLLIATKHSKEKVIAPLMTQEFGMQCHLAENLDTDALGTFSGEIERKLSPLEAAREKCKLALLNSDFDLAIASEGSFGPHPAMPFVPSDEELVYIYDKKNDIEIWEANLSTHTNFAAKQVKTRKELQEFAADIGFPLHALILRKSSNNYSQIVKGIATAEGLQSAFYELFVEGEGVYVETDMRAMHNPTRMMVIEETMKKLIQKMKALCPLCSRPGFAVVEVRKGLPCEQCHFPTRQIYSKTLRCTGCGFEKEEFYPDGSQFADPMYCDICNP